MKKESTQLKMSALSARSGVPAATIKHYLREGLLPPPIQRTGRNMAWYDASVVERIQRIKQLQKEHFLPLKVIRELLDRRTGDGREVMAREIARTLEKHAGGEHIAREQLLASGVAESDLLLFESAGLISPIGSGSDTHYAGDDIILLRTLKAARAAGLTEEMLPPQILIPYVKAIKKLVEIELSLFESGVLPRAKGDLERLTHHATMLSEQLVITIRRKLLLPTLEEMITKRARPRRKRTARKPRRTR